jgi:hypothetical protein
MPRARGRDLAEIFGYAPDDMSSTAASKWRSSYCPFIQSNCTKTNHDRTIIYGSCSVRDTAFATQPTVEVIICPKRLYANDYQTLREVSASVFEDIPLFIGPSGFSVGSR